MRLYRGISRFALAAALAAPALAATWADRGEYDLVMTLRSEPSAQKRLELLDRWQARYPQSELRQVRRELYLAVYQFMGDGTRMFQLAGEMLNEPAGNLVGAYWCTLLVPELPDQSAATWQAGEQAAHQLLAGMDRWFGSAAKPAGTSDAEWQKRAASAGWLAHRALGWIAWQRGDVTTAETEFRSLLSQNPSSAEISAWMGIVLGLQKEPAKQAAALWYLERAAVLRGDGALTDDRRRAVSRIADDVYVAYHGDRDGVEALKSAAAGSAAPPPDFHVDRAHP